MVGRLYRATKCINYEKAVLNPYPTLELKLYNVVFEEFPETLRIPVDTGFEGSILLSSEDYEFFKVGELPKELWRTYRTLTGRIIMRVRSSF